MTNPDSEVTGGWDYAADVPTGDRLGISFSGGGIRSAAFCLGAYQHMSNAGIFQGASYVSGVSGGGYVASALAVAFAESEEEAIKSETPLWSHGSPEEHHLRTNLSYLAPGVRGRIWLVTNFLYGLIFNLTPIFLGGFILGRLYGQLLNELMPHIDENPPGLNTALVRWSLGIVAVTVVIALAGAALPRFLEGGVYLKRATRTKRFEQIVQISFVLATAVFVLGVVVPIVVHQVAKIAAPIIFAGKRLKNDLRWLQHPFTLAAIASALCIVIVIAIAALAIWLLRAGKMPATSAALAWIAGGLLLFAPFVLAAEAAATKSPNATDMWVVVGCLAVLIVFWLAVPNRKYSMHLYYRERLSGAFILRRKRTDGNIVAKAIPYEKSVLFSELGNKMEARRAGGLLIPRFLICAAIAAGEGDVPSRSWATSFTFEPDYSRSPALDLVIPTADLEAGLTNGGADLTLPSIMAISGAAISPMMGRFSLPAFRLLIALVNLRLGVWLPNPQRAHGDERPASGWRHHLKVLLEQPGAGYVFREGLGLTRRNGRYIHVSDGGHWENLGLVELLRRRCTHIVVMDASAGGKSALSDIGRAAAIARAELGVDIDLDSRPTATDPQTGLAEAPVAVGTVRYPDGTAGEIHHARCALWRGAPVDLQVYRDLDSKFPQHPTTNQLLSGEQFDAYRALGWEVAKYMVESSYPSWDSFNREVLSDDEDTDPSLVI